MLQDPGKVREDTCHICRGDAIGAAPKKLYHFLGNLSNRLWLGKDAAHVCSECAEMISNLNHFQAHCLEGKCSQWYELHRLRGWWLDLTDRAFGLYLSVANVHRHSFLLALCRVPALQKLGARTKDAQGHLGFWALFLMIFVTSGGALGCRRSCVRTTRDARLNSWALNSKQQSGRRL